MVLVIFEPAGKARTRRKRRGKRRAAFGVCVTELEQLVLAESVSKFGPGEVRDWRVFRQVVAGDPVCPALGGLLFDIVRGSLNELLTIQKHQGFLGKVVHQAGRKTVKCGDFQLGGLVGKLSLGRCVESKRFGSREKHSLVELAGGALCSWVKQPQRIDFGTEKLDADGPNTRM